MRIILASGSPRRRELLGMLGVGNLDIMKPVRDEIAVPGRGPGQTVRELSAAKACEIAEQCGKDDIIIAADTIVWLDERILGKPKDEADAFNMLRALSGREHTVFSGVTVKRGAREETEEESTRVRFRELSDEEIRAYIATGEPMDKAGSYGAQGKGALFVSGIEGDFFNVMGLPVCRLGRMLERFGVDLLK